MEKIANGNEMCYNCDESSTKGYAIAPIEGIREDFLSKNCCNTSAAAAAKNEIDRIISELSAREKEQLLLMILQAGIPSKTPWNEEEGSPNV